MDYLTLKSSSSEEANTSSTQPLVLRSELCTPGSASARGELQDDVPGEVGTRGVCALARALATAAARQIGVAACSAKRSLI